MGSDSNLLPNRTWFSGRIYLKEALQELEESEASLKDVIEESSSIKVQKIDIIRSKRNAL